MIVMGVQMSEASDFYEAHKDKMRERQEAWSSHAAAPRPGLQEVLTSFCHSMQVELSAIQGVTFERDRSRSDAWMVTFSGRGTFVLSKASGICDPVFIAIGADPKIVKEVRIEAQAFMTGKTRIVARIWNHPTVSEFTLNQQAE